MVERAARAGHGAGTSVSGRPVLCAVYTAGHFVELARLVRLLRRTGAYTPTVWFAWPYQGMGRDIRTCAEENIPTIEDRTGSAVVVPGESEPAPDPGSGFGRVARWARGAGRFVPFPASAALATYRQWQQLRLAQRLVGQLRPACVVVASDDYDTAVLIRAAHQLGVPSVVLPFTVADATEPAEALYHDRRHSMDRWDNRIVGAIFPRWTIWHRGRWLLRMPAPQVVAKQVWGLAPPLPWQLNSGQADALAVESEFMLDYYVRRGIPRTRLTETGSLADDTLAAGMAESGSRRAELCAQLNLPPDRPLVVCAMPPDQFSLSGPQTDFADYGEMLQFWIRTLAAFGWCNVIVKLHPRAPDAIVHEVERGGLKVTQWDTAALVPLCDVFVASVSATIRWALACGKPVVNYDAYRLRFTDYADAPGVLHVEERDGFVAVLRRLLVDEEHRATVAARQRADAGRWGRLDGRSGERVLACIEAMVAAGRTTS